MTAVTPVCVNLNPRSMETMKTFIPWWQCSAVILEGDDEIDLDVEVRAATAEEAEHDARERWSDHGYNPDRVTVRRCDS